MRKIILSEEKQKQIIKMYCEDGESALTIQVKTGINYKKIYHVLKENGIKTRNNSEKTLNAIKQGRISNTELQRKKSSEKWKGKNNPRWKLGKGKCEICDSIGYGGKKKYGKYLCLKHYKQMKLYGEIKKRTRFDDTEYIKEYDYYKIAIYNIKQDIIGWYKIDLDDLNKVLKYKFSLNNGYLVTNKKGKNILLHRLIMNIKNSKLDIDHINEDKLDNRKCNLRITTRSQNLMNRSRSKGITFDKSRNKWVAQIQKNYKHIFLGRYDKKEDALKARIEGESKYFGEFAPKR